MTLLFTYDISLKEWNDKGLFDRELLIYRRLIQKSCRINFVTYGGADDLKYIETAGSIKIYPVYTKIKKYKYEILNILGALLIPFKFKEAFISADVIKANQMNGSWVGVMVKWLYRKKLVVRCGFEWYRNAYTRRKKSFSFFKNAIAWFLEWIVYKFCDQIIISNQSDIDFVKKNFRISDRKIHLIRNFVDTEQFKPLDIQKKEDRILYIGRLDSRKNILNVLKAVKNTPYCLDIIGAGEQEGELKEFAMKNSLNVELMGIVPNHRLPELINRYSVAILASYYENSPKSLLEEMSCGIAVIGTDVPGINEIIKHKENGILCDIDSLSIKKAIEAVMCDRVLREKISKNARLYVIENCSLDNILKKEIEVYNLLIKK